MRAESVVGEAPEYGRTGVVLAAPWASGICTALLLLLAGVEGAHWFARSAPAAALEQVVQKPVPIAPPTSTPDVSAPDPGDNP